MSRRPVEYRVVRLRLDEITDLEAHLNAAGAEGWDVFHLRYRGGLDYEVAMKRPVLTDKDSSNPEFRCPCCSCPSCTERV